MSIAAVLHDVKLKEREIKVSGFRLKGSGTIETDESYSLLSVNGKVSLIKKNGVLLNEGIKVDEIRRMPSQLTNAVKVIGGLAILASLVSAYENYTIALRTEDVTRALAQAGLNCALSAPLFVVGGFVSNALLFVTCGVPMITAIMGIGNALIERTIPVVIAQTIKTRVHNVIGAMLYGFGGGPHVNAIVGQYPIDVKHKYEKAYELAFGTKAEDDIKKVIQMVTKNSKELEELKKRIGNVLIFSGKSWDFTTSAKERIKAIVLKDEGIKYLIRSEIEKALDKVDLVAVDKLNERVSLVNTFNSFINAPVLPALSITSSIVENLAKKVNTLTRDISNVNSRVDSLTRNINSLNAKVENLSEELNSLKISHEKINSFVRDIKSLERVAQEVKYVSSYIERLDEKIDECCFEGLSPEEGEKITKRLKKIPNRNVGSLLNKLLYGGLLATEADAKLLVAIASVAGVIYAAIIKEIVDLIYQ